MHTKEDWYELCDRLARVEEPRCDPAYASLYKMGLADGLAVLRKRFPKLDDADRQDLICDLFAERLELIVRAENPKGYFITALIRRAFSFFRDNSKTGDDVATCDPAAPSAPPDTRFGDGFMIDAKRALDALSPRDAAIVIAVGLGEDREEIARAHGTTRANVDQIVSRLRREFLLDPADGEETP